MANESKGHDCSECGLTATSSSELSEHACKHTEKKPFACDTCDKSFKSPAALRNHTRKKHEGRTYFCVVCGKNLSEPYLLKKHIKKFHTDEIGCSERRLEDMLKQGRKVTPEPRGIFDFFLGRSHGKGLRDCIFCGKTLKNKSCLVNHLRTHTGATPYKCPYAGCDFAGKQKGNLKTHIRKVHTHPDTRNFKCPHCAYACKDKHYRDNHVKRVHYGIRDFVCEYPDCGEERQTKQSLQYHIQSAHTKEKNFGCEVCGQTFTQCGPLLTHKRRVHGMYLLDCVICLEKKAISRTVPCDACRKEFPMTHGEKERAVRDILREYGDVRISSLLKEQVDSIIPCSGSLRRPDIVYVTRDAAIVVEVDEHAHKMYPPSCEISREHEIHEALTLAHGITKVCFLRFNPDCGTRYDKEITRVIGEIKNIFEGRTKLFGPLTTQYFGFPKTRVDVLYAQRLKMTEPGVSAESQDDEDEKDANSAKRAKRRRIGA